MRYLVILVCVWLLGCSSSDEGDTYEEFQGMGGAAVVVEPTKGPWSMNSAWGDSWEGPFPVTEGIVQTVFEANQIPGPPRVQTIQLFRSDGASPPNAEFRARITYGVGARTNSFEVDWLHGSHIQLVCSWARVDFVTYAPSAGAAYDASGGRVVTVGAGIAEGSVATGDSSPTFTPPFQSTQFDQTFQLPDFARLVTVYCDKPANFDLGFAKGAATLLRIPGTTVAANPQGFKIPGGTRAVRIIHTVPPPDVIEYVVVFSLAL